MLAVIDEVHFHQLKPRVEPDTAKYPAKKELQA